MGTFIFIILGFCLFGYAGYKIFTSIFDAFFPRRKETTYTFIDKSVHYHEHKNLSIIDDKTKKDILNNLN